MKAKGCLHPMTCDLVDGEGKVAHWVAWPDDMEEEEGAEWLAAPLVLKNSIFLSEEIWKRILSFRT